MTPSTNRLPTLGQRAGDLLESPGGSIWWLGQWLDIVGRSDPSTIWYVNSGAGRLGRYDPVTGSIEEWPSPSGPESHPYATLIVDGKIWYNESGMRPDALVRFDPEAEALQSWPIPSTDVYSGILWHMRAAGSGDLLIHQSATNHIMRVSVSNPAGSR